MQLRVLLLASVTCWARTGMISQEETRGSGKKLEEVLLGGRGDSRPELSPLELRYDCCDPETGHSEVTIGNSVYGIAMDLVLFLIKVT